LDDINNEGSEIDDIMKLLQKSAKWVAQNINIEYKNAEMQIWI
jgi:hypothetical protein